MENGFKKREKWLVSLSHRLLTTSKWSRNLPLFLKKVIKTINSALELIKFTVLTVNSDLWFGAYRSYGLIYASLWGFCPQLPDPSSAWDASQSMIEEACSFDDSYLWRNWKTPTEELVRRRQGYSKRKQRVMAYTSLSAWIRAILLLILSSLLPMVSCEFMAVDLYSYWNSQSLSFFDSLPVLSTVRWQGVESTK